MEKMKEKFPDTAEVKAKYEVYLKRRTLIVQTIKNSLTENDLMLELMAVNQNHIQFSAMKRPSLVLQ